MPQLPPVGTLEAADQINQIPQADRMNVGPRPEQPIAPIPLAGTGQVQEGTGKGFSQSYTQAVLGAKTKENPANLPMFSAEDVYNPRYNSILPGEDTEEAAAKAQPWYKKWGNATAKMTATALGTFVNGITAIPDTIAGIKNGENPYETQYGNGVDKWLNNLENEFPNYYTHWEQDHPFLSAIPFSGGGANFWSDKFLKNLGFTIGAIGGAAAQDMVIGAATEGIGEIPLIANQVGKAALWLNKLFTGSDRVGELLQLGRQAGRTEQQLLGLRDLARAAAATKVNNGFRFATNLYGAAASEAGFEARDGYNTVKKDLTDDYIKVNGYAPVGKELEDIEAAATASGNVRFGINLALLGVSDAIQFDSLLKPFSAAKAGFKGSWTKEIGELGTIGLKEGSIDEVERVTPKGFAAKAWETIRPHIPAFLSEGVYEEGGQYAAQIGTQNYYERKYLYDKGLDKALYKGDDTEWDARNPINNIIHSTVSGIGDEFGTTEGLENIFLGSLTGLFSSGLENWWNRKENKAHQQQVIDLLNKQGVTGTLKNVYDNAVTAHRISQDMKRAVQGNNLFKYKNFQHEQFVNFITSGAKAGRFDLRLAQLDLLRDMPEDEFKKAFGIDKTPENQKTVAQYVDIMKQKANEIKRTYDLINETFENPYTLWKKANTEDRQLENEKHHEFQGWKDTLTYLASINSDVARRKESIRQNIKKIDGFINPTFVQSLTNRKEVQEYKKTLQERAKGLEQSLKGDLSANRQADAKKLASLTKWIDRIEKALTSPTEVGDQKLFEDLMNYQHNGETDSTDIQIPKSAIPELMKMGIDLNRLDTFKQSSNDAFEVLSSKEGFDQYFRDIQNAKKRAAEAQKAAQQTPTATPPTAGPVVTQPAPAPAPVPTPPPVKTFDIKNKDGKVKTFEEGKEYFLPIEKGGEPQRVVAWEASQEGGLVVTSSEREGAQGIIPLDVLFETDKLGEELDTALDETSNIDDTPPPAQQGTPLTKRGESKKDLAWGATATTDPPYDLKTTPDDNYQRRHQNFLFNMGSSDPEVFNQENKPLLRILPVTARLETQLGISDPLTRWIPAPDDDVDNTAIRGVYVVDKRSTPKDQQKDRWNIKKMVDDDGDISDVIRDMFRKSVEGAIDFVYDQYKAGGATRYELEVGIGDDIITQIVAYKEGGGIFYVDGQGNELSKVAAHTYPDTNKLIYTNFANTDLQYGEEGAREDRYTNKENLDPQKVMDWWREQRKYLLGIEDPNQLPLYQFQVSRGIPNEVDPNVRNSVVDAGLMRPEDLNKPVIEILTLGNVAVNGALNSEGEGISAHKTSVNMGDMGKAIFNYGGNMGYLDSRRFNNKEARNIFEMIKLLSDRATEGKREIFNYLHKLIYLPNAKTGKGATESSITIEGSNLYLGTSKTPILMNPINIENNKAQIVAFLEGSFHNIQNSELLRIAKNPKASDLKFNELEVDNGKVKIAREWPTYNHYLLSGTYPEGGRRTDMPLSTKIVRPQEGEVPMIQKYSVLQGMQIDTSKMQLPEPEISQTQRDKLTELGWSKEQISKMTPKLVDTILSKNISAEENKKMAENANKEQGVKKEEVKEAPKPALTEEAEGIPEPEQETIIDTIQLGTAKFGISNVQRDDKGNITDFDVLGLIQEDGKIKTPTDATKLKIALLAKVLEGQMLREETPEEKKGLEDRLSENRDVDPDSQYRYAPIINPGSYTKADITRELEEAQRMIPQVPIHLVDNLIKRTGGGFAWGALQNASIYLYKEAEVGTTYHEAFEAVWGHFLDGKEQRALYQELTSREGNFTTYEGQSKPFKEATVQEAKEQMAEEFRDYKQQAKPTPKTAIERFFQRLIDFIKRVFLGDKSEINKVFKKLNRGDYRNYSTSLRDVTTPQYARVGGTKMSEAMIQDVLQGMTVEMFMDIFRDNQDIIIQLEENPERGAAEIYSKLKDKLTTFFESEKMVGNTLEGTYAGKNGSKFKAMTPAQQAIAIEQIKSIRDKWAGVKANWDQFVNRHKTYLKVFNVEYTIDDDGNIAFADDEYQDETDRNQVDWDRDIFQIDAKNAASPKVKLLIATIADSYWKVATSQALGSATADRDLTVINRDNSEVKLPKQAQYAKLFNYMLHNLSNINGLYEMWSKMEEMTSDPEKRKKIDANMKRVMVRMGFTGGFKGKTLDQIKMLLALENTLSKQKPAFFRQFTDQGRKTYFKTSVLNSKLAQVKTQWISGMMASKSVASTNDGRFLFNKDLIGIGDNIKFLNKLGINIEKSEYDRLKGKDLKRFNDSVNKIRGVVEKAARDKIYIPVMSSREIDFNSRMDEIAELYISNITGDDSQSQHPNLDNEPTSNFVLNNFISTILADANNATNREDFINRVNNEYFNDIFHHDSLLLGNILFNSDGSKNDRQVEVGVVEGRQSWNGDNKSSANLTEAERQLYEFNNNINGVFYTLLPADAKTEWAINVGTYLSAPTYFRDEYGKRDEVSRFTTNMYQWLQTEIDLAKDFESRKHIIALNRKVDGREVGKSLRFFGDILPKDVVERINKQIIDGDGNLEDIYTEPELRSHLVNYIADRARGTLDDLLDWNLIDYSEKANTYKLNGFDNSFLANSLGSKKEYSEAEVMSLFAFREMNYVMNNIEMHKFFFGDPAQYKDELKRIKSFLSGRESTHVDTIGTDEGLNQVLNQDLNKVSKTGPQLKPEDPGYHQFKNHFNTFTLYDVEYHSNSIEDIEKAIGKEKSDPYKRGNEADAQALMMATAYREMMIKAGGRWTNSHEEQFQWFMAWERNDKAKEGKYTYTDKELQKADKEILKLPENTKIYFPVLKLVHSGIQTEDGVAIVSLDKASWAPLFYKWYKGKTLGKLHDALQKKGVDYVRMESAHKVGMQSQAITRLYNDEGEFNTDGIGATKDEHISMKHLGIQVEQTKKEKGQTEGSQARKIAIGDLRSNGVPIDFLKGKNQEDAFKQWNELSEDQRLEQSPIYQKINRHDEALKRLTEQRTDQTMKRLGIAKQGDIYTVPDKKKISDFILDELQRRELPNNIAYGLEVVYGKDGKTSDFVQPLEANAQYTKIRSIIYSVMEKTIMRPKVSGGQKTMLSVTGFETDKRIVKETINGKPVYTTDLLKFYTVEKDGTQACEVMLPYWFGKQLEAYGSNKSKEEVIKYLNETEEGRKLLTGIGFRIPTQGLNSIDFFTVKDFLPEQMGDVVVLPSEITAKAGSDFDIDKLNTYLRNFYVDNRTGFPVPIEWKGDAENTRKYIDKLFDSGNILSVDDRNELDRYIEEQRDLAEEIDFGSDFPRLFPKINDKIQSAYSDEALTREWLEGTGNYINIIKDKIYMQALENEYFDAMEDLLKLPENFNKLVQPNDASQLKEDRTYIKGLIEKREGKSEQSLGNYGRLLDSRFMMKERHAYLMSKGVVGPSAVSQTAHAVSQNMDGGLVVTDPNIIARFPHNEINGQISLSGLTINGSDQYISNINSQTTDGGVDVAKDKFLAEMGINRDTLTTFLALTRMGAPRRWSELFINQPAIQRFLKLKAIYSSVSEVNPNIKKTTDWEIRKQVAKEYGFTINSKKILAAFMEDAPSRWTQEEMEAAITSKELGGKQKKSQVQMLDDYLKYNGLAWDLFHFYQGYNWDTARLNDPNEVRFKELKYMKANGELAGQWKKPAVSRVGKVMKSFIGTMRDKTLQLDAGLRSLINVQTGPAGSILDNIAEDIFNTPKLTAYDRQQVMLAAETAMVDFAVQTGAVINGKPMISYINALLMGDKSIARYIEAIQKSEDPRLNSNPFIKNLLANIDKRKEWPSIVQLAERDYDTYTSNVWTDSFRELKDDNTVISINDNPNDDRTVAQIYKNLVLGAIIMSGSKKTSTSLSHLIPNESYSEFTKDALRNMDLTGFYNNNVLYRTNWMNDKLVPQVEAEYDEIDPEYYWYPFFVGENAVITKTLEELLGTQKPAGILNVDSFKYGKYKAIKIRETHTMDGQRLAIPLVRLFERVDIQDIEGQSPLILEATPNSILFKEINAWGDGNKIQEYHKDTTQSVLPNNFKVDEVSNDHLLYALQKAGYQMNIADETVEAAVNRLGLGGEDTDELGNTEPRPDPDPITGLFGPEERRIQEEWNKGWKIWNEEKGDFVYENPEDAPKRPSSGQLGLFEPEDDIEECSGGNFSVKTDE